MKNYKTEFILGLTGGILGILISGFLVLVFFTDPIFSEYVTLILPGSIFILLIQIFAVIFSFQIYKLSRYKYGVTMIVIGIISIFLTSFILIIPAILYIASGIRILKLKNKDN
ncbi:hypothetical protein ABE65_017795 [Fictibacillus phosphorivorans]|uniref:DUF4064 domain-containing protein n=1 Tax=Fictibacillus phosphorivorans TaxID=1221500 RepID=A0A160IQ40_9BACL|nr:hypothetical protein [Fictibacillus phosphorivorans]ANC78551.1 hypothetical protein ABE65_017795 [Fictibacillus phosphorivorans]